MKKEVYEVEFSGVLEGIREELGEHLEAINETTNEIETNNEVLLQVNERLEKLAERVDQIAWYLKRKDDQFADEAVYNIQPLTNRERDVFMALYELNQSIPAVSYKDLAYRLQMTASLVQSYVSALIEKGVPVEKRLSNKGAFVCLKPQFMRMQAKHAVIGVDAKLTAWL